MRCLLFDCGSGIAGDMAVAAMIGLGADRERLLETLRSLDLEGFDVRISEVGRNGIAATDFDVVLEEDNRDHDMEYLYGSDAPEERHPHHAHRTPEDIRGIIARSSLAEDAKGIALRILAILSEAEAHVHGIPVEEVHLHEVGAVDSIVDIVSLAFCIDDLGFDEVRFTDLCDGTGSVRCMHGTIPVPVPAVTEIARRWSLPLTVTSMRGEHVTPTGAAFAAAVRTGPAPKGFVIEKVGTGAGKREGDGSGVVRAMVVSTPERDSVLKMECDIDDCSGEMLGHAISRLLREGAKDANASPIVMKKSRPAWRLTVICGEDDRERMERIVFEETTTIGIRCAVMDRTVLDRTEVSVDTPWGPVAAKRCTGCGIDRIYPEYDDTVRIAEKNGIPLRDVYAAVSYVSRG